jgi:hypothetical protein
VLRGAALANDSDIAREAQFVLLDRTGEVTLEANNDATVLILSNAPIDEPVHSSFIINTTDGIRQGMIDFQSGRFGAISALNHKPRECVLMRRRKELQTTGVLDETLTARYRARNAPKPSAAAHRV